MSPGTTPSSQPTPEFPTKVSGGVHRPPLRGIHHVRLPVSDVTASTSWYAEVLGLPTLLLEEEESEVVGAVLSVGDGPGVGCIATRYERWRLPDSPRWR